jgi:hypothetical protein
LCDSNGMLGWHVSVYRQEDGGASPATWDSRQGTRLAVWQTDLFGLEWLDELVKAGKARDLRGNGYPNRYTAPAQYLIPQVIDKPPEANKTWVCGPDDVIGPGWDGKTVTNPRAAGQCRPDEWLLVVAWDES